MSLARRARSMSARFAGSAVLASTALLLGGAAHGDPAAVDPEVVRRSNAVLHASGPATYGALRSLAELWDLADPSDVEAALVSASESASLSPSAKAYASILIAEARKRRG